MATICGQNVSAPDHSVPITTCIDAHKEEEIESATREANHSDATSTQTTSMTDDKSVSPAKTLRKHEEHQSEPSAVQALARSYSCRSSGGPQGNPFIADADSPLNPNSPNFSATEWAKTIMDMFSDEGTSLRSTGVCFQNLNVHGFGAGTDYQKDVANVWLSLAGMARRLVSDNRQRINILSQFDGLVREGEMLVVLGPPGSGCSTFLKTIAGETNGIYVGESSYFNYHGKSQHFPTLSPVEYAAANMYVLFSSGWWCLCYMGHGMLNRNSETPFWIPLDV